ncbi:hypothetical protein FF011L_06070 [Roseimaritima multifibrata]|uniref:Peptidase M48 domain-containing protein n=1 Tax=Roseimaritima multifibrata TaxID=1930274 RepID=A0A517MAJ7_9BACT|nr:M48 family metallopeptidase [Roseimaritima multifibrata]QDS91871.1 hypothetical protein FF011L_06070 [Roseimaritima multifibrata]
MDFFEHQDRARRNSKKLTFLFILAVIGVVLSVYVLLGLAVTGYNVKMADQDKNIDLIALLTNWQILLTVGGGTLLLVGGASAYRISSLQGGGQVVASSLGGRPLQQSTTDRDERRVLNVVEEMAIASGIPVPPVFLLEEEGINAFAAGYTPQDAVIGVTRGCVQTMTRDELQGVMAHEFSHILNGDMRMNIRMIGYIYGIMVIGFIGWQVFRIALYSGGSRRNNKDSSPIPLIVIGGGLIAIGAIGVFFGNWIKASFSRQREFLADASAVQFTRNPHGIAGALMQIGASPVHGEIKNPAAPEFSHMYFATGATTMFSGLFATHPPLEQRILRIEPRWDGKFPKRRSPKSVVAASDASAEKEESRKKKIAKGVTILAGIEAIGQPTPSHLSLAHKLISEIPDAIKEASRNPYGARAVLYALLLNREPVARRQQLAQLEQHAERGLAKMTEAIAAEISKLDEQHRLPLVDMTLGALKSLSPTQYNGFMANLDVLIKADNKIELFEWVVVRVVHHHLGPPDRSRPKYHSLEKVSAQCSMLLSSLAWAGQGEPAAVQSAFDAGANALNVSGLTLLPPDKMRLSELGKALDVLDLVDMSLKKSLIQACAECIVADHQVTAGEAELMRAIADSFGCPMPPLFPPGS